MNRQENGQYGLGQLYHPLAGWTWLCSWIKTQCDILKRMSGDNDMPRGARQPRRSVCVCHPRQVRFWYGGCGGHGCFEKVPGG